MTWGSLAQGWDPAVLSWFLASGPTAPRTVDVTEAVWGWLQGVPNRGLLLEEDPVDRTPFYSSEHGVTERHPALEVCYAP